MTIELKDGLIIGKMTIIGLNIHETKKIKNKARVYDCKCECGKERAFKDSVLRRAVKENTNISCGKCYTFEDWCNVNDKRMYLELWDYEKNDCSPCDIPYSTHEKYRFKCREGVHPSEEWDINSLTSGKCKKIECRICSSFGYYLEKNCLLDLWDNELNIVDKYDISKCSNIKVWMKCGEDGHPSYKLSCNQFVNSSTRCGICSGKKIHKDINSISATHKDICKYFINIEDTYVNTSKSQREVFIECPNCRNVFKTKIQRFVRNENICPKCSDGISFPERVMFCLLSELHESFETQYSPIWANAKKYDFYVPNKKVIIEMDGMFHYMDNKMNGETAKKAMEVDKLKDDVANKNGIKVIRVECKSSDFKYIKSNILKTDMKDYFDLNQLRWDVVYKSSMLSLVKLACDKWNDGGHTTITLSKELGLSVTTTRKYLKIGVSLELCDYDASRERVRVGHIMQSSKDTRRKIRVTHEDGKVEVFESCSFLAKISETKFGKSFNVSSLHKACKEHREYKGIKIEYED